MLEIIAKSSLFSALKGSVGSNPQIVRVFPQDPPPSIPKKKLIELSLPHGIEPGSFVVNKYKGKRVVAYAFELERKGERNDLVSLGFLIDDDVILDELKVLVEELVNFLKKNDLLNYEILQTQLPTISEGLNSREPMVFKTSEGSKRVFETPEIIKNRKLKLKRVSRKSRGGFL